MHSNRCHNITKKVIWQSYESKCQGQYNSNVSQNRALSHQAKICPSFDYPIKYFQSKIEHQAYKHTCLKHCIIYRVPVCILTDYAMKPKKLYGSHIKANFKENTILLCFRIGLHYNNRLKNALLLTILSNIFQVKLHIRQINIRA